MSPRNNGLRAREIGKRIQQARKEAGGMTQRELADLLGVTERSVAAYEAGDVVPYRYLRQLESALGRPAAWFLYGDEVRPDAMLENQEKILELLREILEAVRK